MTPAARLTAMGLLLGATVAAGTWVNAQDEDKVEVLEIKPEDEPRPEIDQKYPDMAGADIVTDAPWRVVRRRNGWIPLLLFVPDANLPDRGFFFAPNRFRGLQFTRITVYANGELVYEDTNKGSPTHRSDVTVVSERGQVVNPADLAGGVTACVDAPRVECDVKKPGGWHRILRIPVSRFTRDTVFLKTEIVAQPVYEEPVSGAAPLVYSRTLRVELAPGPFPSLGPSWRYFDAHMHTIAEWSLAIELLAPRKAFGGPVQMIKESAWALGFTDGIGDDHFVNRVIATDHNAFFSDHHIVPAGPTSDRPTSFTHDHTKFRAEAGQIEFANMRRLFGFTFSEEITLRTPLLKDGFNSGSHMLLFRAEHLDGPWHGGLLAIRHLGRLFGGEKNENTLERTLETAARQPGAFAYAAHPHAAGNHWGEDKLTVLESRSAKYVGADRKFVLKGAQYWNEKSWLELDAERGGTGVRVRNVDFFDLHPFADDVYPTPLPREAFFRVKRRYPKFVANPAWDEELQKGLIDWHRRVRRLLRFSLDTDPEAVFPRKLYAVGGSDAHGDFNYTTSLLATVLDRRVLRDFNVSRRQLTSNAFGRVRTYVDTTGKDGAPADQALNAMSDGNAIITDGPVVTFTVDADLRYDGRASTWRGGATMPPEAAGSVSAFDDDGRIGGHGAGDGGYTALVVRGTRHAALKYRWDNTSEFGPAFEGTPTEINLYVDTAEPAEPATVQETRRAGTGQRTLPVLKPVKTIVPKPGERSPRETIVPLNLPETSFLGPTAISLGIVADNPAGERFRGYTNPVWIVPVDVVLDGHLQPVVAAGVLRVTFTFAMSMRPQAYEVFLMPLDAGGNGTSGRIPLTPDPAFGANGWDAQVMPAGRTRNAIYRVTNAGHIVDAAAAGGRFVVVLRAPRDLHDNVLNAVAAPITIGPTP